MKMHKRILALILAVAMLAGFGVASAEGDEGIMLISANPTTPLGELAVGEKAERGIYTVDRLDNDVWHIEDYTADNPRGMQFDENGAMLSMNNCSDMYVVLGEEKALLVDLSNYHEEGVDDLVAIFDELAGEREKEIFITHSHGDHTGMYAAFSDTDIPMYITAEDHGSIGNKKDRVTPIVAGEHEFDLGGRTLKLVLVPGHTPGSNMLYEVETNIGFTGDAVGSGSGIWLFGTFLQYEKGLKNLMEVIDGELGGKVLLYGGHTWQQETATGHVDMDRQYVADMQTLVSNVETGGEYTMAEYTASPALNTVVGYGKALIDVSRAELAGWALKSGKGLGGFTDINDPILDKAVTTLVAAGVTKGTSYTTYEPSKTLDRAEFMTMLGRTVGAKVDQNADTGFTDVVADGWSVGYIAWGVENELIEGYGDGTFGQYDTLTKEHVNTIIGRFNEKFGGALFGGVTPFADATGDATRADIATLLSGAIGNRDFMTQMLLPKTLAGTLDPDDYKAWGAFPEDDDYVQGLSASQNPNMATALELYDVFTYTNKDANDHELAQTIKYYVHDPIKHGADPNGKYPVQVWFHGAGNALDGDAVVSEAGALLFATEEYQELMGTPVYVVVPIANEYKNEFGGNEGIWMTETEDGRTSVYTKVLGDLVSDFMAEHADTVSTLHINGTSAGGYMAWRYTEAYTDTVASTFLMAPAIFSVADEGVESFLEKTKDIPVLHIHGLHDELVGYDAVVTPYEEQFNAAENYQLVPFEWVRTRDGGVASMFFGMEMGQHCICAQVAEDLKFADGTPMHEDLPNGVTGWYKEILGN